MEMEGRTHSGAPSRTAGEVGVLHRRLPPSIRLPAPFASLPCYLLTATGAFGASGLALPNLPDRPHNLAANQTKVPTMTTTTPQDLYWVTCSVTIEGATIEVSADSKINAIAQAEAAFKLAPWQYLSRCTTKMNFRADYAPLDAHEG